MGTSHKTSVAWHTNALPKATKRALDFFAQAPWLKRSRWYLAGGTALALQAGHRTSVDLDFFTPSKDFASGKLIARFPADAWETNILREGTVYGKLLGAKVSFIAYPFFVPKQAYHKYGMVSVLDAQDIAVMKIIAISQRGRKRDFVDLYWYCLNRESLRDILLRVSNQYPTVAHDFHHIIKSLCYFEDAEADPLPTLFFRATWSVIKQFFLREVKKISKEFLLR